MPRNEPAGSARLKNPIVFGLLLAFAACGGESNQRRRSNHDDAGGEGGELGVAAASGSGGSSGRSGGSAGTSAAAGGTEAGTRTVGGEGGEDSGGEAGSAGGGTSGNGGSGGTAGSAGTTADACEGVECSGHGECRTQLGVARCECEPGYSPLGLECVTCPSVSGTYDIDVPIVTLSGAVTVNGSAPVTTGTAGLRFVNDDGDTIDVGEVQNGAYTLELLPDTYDIYVLGSDAEGIPDNGSALLLEDVEVEESRTLDIDIPMVVLSGSVAFGDDPSATSVNTDLYFAQTLDFLAWTPITGSTYSIELVPGTYDIAYSGSLEDLEIPINQLSVVREDVIIDDDGTLDVEIPMVTVAGDVTINGEALPSNAVTYLYLRHERDLPTMIPLVPPGSFTAVIIPGTYDVYYAGVGEPGVPGNSNALLLENVEIGETRRLDIDVPMLTLSGGITVNGAGVTSEVSASVALSNGDDYVALGRLESGDYAASIVPGTYDLVYAAHSLAGNDGAPDNQFAVLERNLTFDETRSFSIDIPMAVLTGNVSVNDAPPSGNAAATFYFNNETGDAVIAATLESPTYRAEFVPGTYDGFYSAQVLDGTIPANFAAPVLRDLEIAASRTLDLEVPGGVTLAGTVTVAGTPMTNGDAVIRLYGNGNDTVDLGHTNDVSYSTVLVPGTYNVVYQSITPGTGLPMNYRTRLGCVQVE
ncbi:MAG TPA: calcium-binding EGF-like domain-containing protein [Polyangiaceae bacterium]